MEVRTEYAVHWDHVDGMPDFGAALPTREQAQLALDGSGYSGRIVERSVVTSAWRDAGEPGETVAVHRLTGTGYVAVDWETEDSGYVRVTAQNGARYVVRRENVERKVD